VVEYKAFRALLPFCGILCDPIWDIIIPLSARTLWQIPAETPRSETGKNWGEMFVNFAGEVSLSYTASSSSSCSSQGAGRLLYPFRSHTSRSLFSGLRWFVVRLASNWNTPLNRLRAKSRVSPVVELLPSASGHLGFGMTFPSFLMKQLYRCDSVVIASFVETGYTGCWQLGRRDYDITRHYPWFPL
jgi:hypothetical protein